MFRHRGKHRTPLHNMKLASLLSFVAGMVNVVGFLEVGRLTTNVTGHFVFFSEELISKEYKYSFVFLLYIFSFLAGAFLSNLSIEIFSRKKERYNNIIPISLEIGILAFVAFSSSYFIGQHQNLIACLLLFAMGMQNALVTQISNSIVRTTHLTGLFTDLGIELSQLFFYKGSESQKKLRSSIKLRLSIIVSFFIGSTVGGLGYFQFGVPILLLSVILLLLGLWYDTIKFKIVRWKRKFIP